MTPRTPITGDEVADVLERAADIIEQNGWQQHIFHDGSTGCYCTAGAILHARGTDWWKGRIEQSELQVLGFTNQDGLYSWNDAPERTQAEVVAALREAATAARQQGGGREVSAGPRCEGESKAAYHLRIWHAMTPADRDYDRVVARQIPQGATWGCETEGGRKAEAERDRLIDEAGDSDGCSCHINPPCSYCMRQSEEEDA